MSATARAKSSVATGPTCRGFALYARTDARLALEIIEKMRLIPLALARSRLTGMQPDRVSASIASFDFVYLAELHKRDIVAPTVRSGDARVSASQTGGHVLEPTTGLHSNVWVFDFKSLYPSVMRTFNIDPLAFVAGVDDGEDVIRTTTGAAFRRGDAILPGMLDRLAEARRRGETRGRRHRFAGDQDSHELVLRRARDARLSFP